MYPLFLWFEWLRRDPYLLKITLPLTYFPFGVIYSISKSNPPAFIAGIESLINSVYLFSGSFDELPNKLQHFSSSQNIRNVYNP